MTSDRAHLRYACQQWSVGGVAPIACLCLMVLNHILRPWTFIAQMILLATQLAATGVFIKLTRDQFR